MAISGTWKSGAVQDRAYVGATKWGTGINPVHSKTDDGTGRNIAPGGSEPSPEELVGPEQWGYCGEDMPGEHFEYIATYPEWDNGDDVTHTQVRPQLDAAGYPSWGRYPTTGGAGIRAVDHGAPAESGTHPQPSEPVSMGWLNKVRGQVNDSEVSAPEQYEVQTSMRQRDGTLVNTRAVTRQTDVDRSSLPCRIPGMREKHYSQRDMDLKTQDVILRPYSYRSAGVGPSAYMDQQFNDWPARVPMTRTTPPDPYMGEQAGDYGYAGGDYFG